MFVLERSGVVEGLLPVHNSQMDAMMSIVLIITINAMARAVEPSKATQDDFHSKSSIAEGNMKCGAER